MNNTNTHDQQEPTPQAWTNYAAAPADTRRPDVPEKHNHRHGAHMWMMLLMCLPLVAVGIWSFASGANPGGLIAGLLCMGMMAVMHLGMGRGKSHRH